MLCVQTIFIIRVLVYAMEYAKVVLFKSVDLVYLGS